jgi:hypothetical protein
MTTYTTNLKLTQPNLGATGWGTTVNNGITALVDDAVAGLVSVDVTSGNATLTTANGATDQARNMFIRAFGASVARDVIVPAVTKLYFVVNDCTADVTFKVSAQTGVAVPAGKTAVLRCDGTDIVPAVTYLTELTTGGDLSFGGTAQRIIGDFSNATLADRVAFQTGTTNGNTNIHALTNGTGTTSSFQANNSSDLSNGSQVYITAGASEAQLVSDKTGTGTYLPLTFYTGGSERVHVDTSGNVGIGTSSPIEKLDVLGTAAGSAFAVRFSNSSSTADSAAVLSLDPGNNGFNVRDGQIHAINNGANQISLAFFTSSAATPVEAMRIDASGNVLVGTTNTNADTSDGIRFLPTGSAGASFVSFTNGGNGGANLSLVNSNGSTTSWNAIVFQFNTSAVGSISCTPTTTAYNQSSDRRLKTAVAPAADAGALLDAVQVVEFDWKVGGHVRYGVIAQDLHLIAPEVVTPGDSNEEVARPWGVDYSKLVPMLIKEVQSLRARVAELESK